LDLLMFNRFRSVVIVLTAVRRAGGPEPIALRAFTWPSTLLSSW